MDKLNPASVPRSEKIVGRSLCGAADPLGSCVRITLPKSGNLFRVGKVTSSTMVTQAVGVIIKKLSPTVCYVQFHGPVKSVYAGLTAGLQYVVGTDGKPAAVGDANYPIPDGINKFQQIGVATGISELLVHPLDTSYAVAGQGTRFIRQPLSGAKNGINKVFVSALKFVASGPFQESVYLNGLLQSPGVGVDYVVSESGGPGTGFDTITFTNAPRAADKVFVDFVPA